MKSQIGVPCHIKDYPSIDEKLWPSFKVCDYTLNFMAMSCLLQLTVLWQLSKATRFFLVQMSITIINESQIQ
jgi:hypothetical protein